MADIWIINGRCEQCVQHDCGGDCDCWCHDLCPDCGRGDCTGEDCYWPDEAEMADPTTPSPVTAFLDDTAELRRQMSVPETDSYWYGDTPTWEGG